LIEERRSTRITVEATHLLNGVDICGLWGRKGEHDIVLHAETTSEFHRAQIILHEFAHMILDHDAQPLGTTTSGLAAALFPDLDPRRFRLRSRFECTTEQTAELLADLLAETLRRNKSIAHPLEETFS
jgi:hypothetical protein